MNVFMVGSSDALASISDMGAMGRFVPRDRLYWIALPIWTTMTKDARVGRDLIESDSFGWRKGASSRLPLDRAARRSEKRKDQFVMDREVSSAIARVWEG